MRNITRNPNPAIGWHHPKLVTCPTGNSPAQGQNQLPFAMHMQRYFTSVVREIQLISFCKSFTIAGIEDNTLQEVPFDPGHKNWNKLLLFSHPED